MPAAERLKLRHLQSLVALAENGSVVRAAVAMSITQPAVSKTIAELEDIVGQRLFVRTRKGVELNEAGRVLLRYAGSSLRTIREGLDNIARSRNADAPAIVIGALPNVAATMLPQVLVRFLADQPHARLRVRGGSNAELIAALRQGELDLVIGRLAEPSDMQGLSFEQFYAEALVFAVRPGHPLAALRRPTPASLAGHRLILPDAGTRIRDAADRFFMVSGLGLPDDAIETIDATFSRNFVLQSDAVWCAPAGVVENEVRLGSLTQLAIDTRMTIGPVGLTLRADRIPSEALRRLIDDLRHCAADRAVASGSAYTGVVFAT